MLRSTIPMTQEALRTKVVKTRQTYIAQTQCKQKQQHDKCAEPELPLLNQNDRVRYLMHDNKWAIGRIIERNECYNRDYKIQAENGKIFRRNRKHIYKIKDDSTMTQNLHTHTDTQLQKRIVQTCCNQQLTINQNNITSQGLGE